MIDRGPDGFKILLDMARRHNGELVLGEDEAEAVELWFYNGGEMSLADFLWLNEEDSQTVWEYMQDLPLYEEIYV